MIHKCEFERCGIGINVHEYSISLGGKPEGEFSH